MADEPDPDLDSTTLAQRVALLGVADLAACGETPAHSGDVRRTCSEHLDALEDVAVGRVSEADVMRALNALAAAGIVEEVEPDDTSAVGKGRPEYDLRADPDAVLGTLGEDNRVAPAVAVVSERRG